MPWPFLHLSTTRSFGASSKDLALPYSPGLWASQVEAFVRSVVGGPVVLVGNSLGSLVALMVAQVRERMLVQLGPLVALTAVSHPGLLTSHGRYHAVLWSSRRAWRARGRARGVRGCRDWC